MTVSQREKSALSEWRFDICVKLGFAVEDATVLAERHDIDLHEIIELVQIKGCPPQYAFEILL
jgi:hypothetical protein